MRTLTTDLYTAQRSASITPCFTLKWDGVDYTDRLISYTYREVAQRGALTEITVDNRDAALTTTPPALGVEITLRRGLKVAGSAYRMSVPRLWLESIVYRAGTCVLRCIDFWGKLARYRYSSTVSYSAQSASTIATAILGTVGLTNAGGLTSLTLDFTIPANERADRALQRLLAKVPEQAYSRLGGLVKFKELDPLEVSVYSFGWNVQHPVLHATQIIAAWDVNSVTVNGALQSDGTCYSGSASDSAQIALVGTRHLHLRDRSLVSDSDCAQRAQAELDLSSAAARQIHLRSLPCFGLEIYDVVDLWFPPWNPATYITARVGGFEEVYASGTFEQRIVLSRPERTGSTDLADLPEGLFSGDAESVSRIAPGALAGAQTVGAVVRGGDGYSTYSAATLAAEFFSTTGRPAQAGDALLVYESGVGAFRVYVCESASTPTWVYFNPDGSV